MRVKIFEDDGAMGLFSVVRGMLGRDVENDTRSVIHKRDDGDGVQPLLPIDLPTCRVQRAEQGGFHSPKPSK